MDRKQFLMNVLLACIGLGLVGYMHCKISKLYNYVDKNNKIVFSLMTEMREEVKRHFNGESLSELASIEAVTAVTEVELNTRTDKNSRKIELSDDSASESDDTEQDELEDEIFHIPFEDDSVINLKEEKIVENRESIKVVNLMKGLAIENSIVRNVELDVENLIFYRNSFNTPVDNIKINDISVVQEILDICPELTSANISEIVEILDIRPELTSATNSEIIEIKNGDADLAEIKNEFVEINELGSPLEKNAQDFSQLRVEDLRKMVHIKTGEKKEVIKKMKKSELVDLLSK